MTPNDIIEFCQGIAAIGFAAAMIQGTYHIHVLKNEVEVIENSY